jgi:hypothetical protein
MGQSWSKGNAAGDGGGVLDNRLLDVTN